MKDKIKRLLVAVVHVMNVPFFTVRMLIMFIPIVLGSMIADYTDDEYCHFAASMLLAVYTSGPIGVISRILMWKMCKIDGKQLRDHYVERIKKEIYK